MDAAQKLNDNFLSCAVCMEKFKDPCSLGCSHTFCRSCLGSFTMTNDQAIAAKSIMCPTCREMSKVPRPDQPVEDWPKQFKPHFLIQSLLDDFGEAIDAQGALNISKEEKEVSQESKCEKHNAAIEFCCKDCNKAICAKCGLLFHKKCKTVPLESMVHEMRSAGMEAMARIRSTLHDLKGNVEIVESDIKRRNEMKALLEMKIGNISQHAIQIIQQKERMLQDELEETTKRTDEQLKEKVVITENKMEMYESELEHMTKAFESGSELDLYQLYQQFKGLKCDVDIVSPALSMHLVNELKISEFKDSFELCTLKEVQDELGEPVLVQTINTRSKDDLYQDIFDVTVLSFDGKEAIVITDCYINSVTVLSNRDGVKQKWKLRFQVKPLSLSKLNERQVVVCFETKKEFALVNICPKPCVQSKCTTLKLYRCLTVLGPNRLAGACEDPPSVDIIDLSGTVLQNVCTAKTGLSTIMREPWFISNNNGNIVLTDANSQYGVTALDRDGKVLFKKKIGQKDGTSGITPGQLQGVIVADLFNYRVLELTETGEINRELLTHSDGLQSPYGVCMHRGKLYVAEGEHGVKVFRFKAERVKEVEEEEIYDEYTIQDD